MTDVCKMYVLELTVKCLMLAYITAVGPNMSPANEKCTQLPSMCNKFLPEVNGN